MRLQADMSEGFWADAVNHASYLVNMSPVTTVNLQIAEEMERIVSGLFNLTDIRLSVIQFG